MAKINFDDSGRNFVEIRRAKEGGVDIIMSAKDPDNPRKNRINTVSLTSKQFNEFIEDIEV